MELIRFTHLAGYPVRHGITTRSGGAGSPPYATLNLGLHVGDRPETVAENRRRTAKALAANPARFTAGEQVHGNRVAVVGEEEAGRGAFRMEEALAGIDALVTALPETPLLVLAADCVPLLLYDPERHVAAAVHAGWRGTVADIVGETVRTMAGTFGSDPARILAGIGPSMGPSCYQVGEEVVRKAEALLGQETPALIREGAEARFDLWEANKALLERAGVPRNNVETLGLCTHCRTDLFFSYRAENGLTGRIGAVIVLD